MKWVFDRTDAAGGDGQYLVVSLSAADDELNQPAAQLLAVQLAALADLFPAARGAWVVDAFVTREPHATFRQRAGTAALRPAASTRWPGLALAGAWTRTGWPDTLEGAVRSGAAAADHLGVPRSRARSQAGSPVRSQAMEGT
ncbi:FAD-dependent oxidoreductase [Actinopolymorpha singaporensis]|uniref:FAD-dependent oxidoreductase n=1 Tax=Actinopolymorpha singaporensis TaxID=117157 RepID=UPI000B150D39|nr:FAD-dependent oxidoreductase [Actinopolymorpha singaporensis]